MSQSLVLSVTNAKPQQKGESVAAYRERLIRALNKISEKDWKQLPDDVQEWTNTGVRALDEGKEVAPAPWEDVPEEGDDAADETPPEKKGTKKGKKGNSSKKDDAAPDAPEKAESDTKKDKPAAKKSRGQGSLMIRESMLDKPGKKLEEYVDKVNAKGVGPISVSTAQMIRYELNIWTKLFRERGLLSKEGKALPYGE